MEIKNRLFPYPVLSVDSDDYSDSEFSVNAEILEQNTNNIVLKFNISLDNKGLKRLVDKGLAEYVIHIECSTTAFRTTIRTFSQEEIYRISNSKVNGDVSLLGMVVSKEEIPHFNNVLLNSDYEDADITMPEAAIMAYCNMPKLRVMKNYEELANEESLFSIVKRTAIDEYEETPISFSFDPDRIRISVGEGVYKSYVQFKNNVQMQPMIHSLLLLPALVEMVDLLRTQGYEDYESSRWFMAFEKMYDANGKDFVNDVIYGDQTIMDIAQEMLRLPIGKAFANIPELLGESEE
ncbi:hypothetical protein [Butyrivibrio sp. AE3009]|uniref:hypothetical protein n=1 Tax=Butyrivibrio sp. AE3009 TaxID=1280666 RepID=UPI0003B60360|nr:hypothetical protein [Butyrivibrio sp. AE3009]